MGSPAYRKIRTGKVAMVKRICIIFPDQSLTILSSTNGEAAALAQARAELKIWNRDKRQPQALMGEIDINLMSFKERC